ncbi:hypothetical protein [Fibrobacter sp.]|uniref:hypothetical protein n=1 Tax=Fibrobacter sp. TaxID=35828 RepID=UPI0025BCBAEC|nr:hypothetical protein [Fibrobacter sp.]MBR4007841.1 hypothetical protein [Fibrobacter sp.]
MNYNRQYQTPGYGPQYPQNGGYGGQQYPQGGGYGQPPSAMGFHSQGGHMGTQYGQPRSNNDDHEKVLAFFRSVAYGEQPCPEELKQVILGVVGEQANGMLAQYGYTQQGGEWGNDPARHHRYKEVLEELRDVPNVIEAEKKFDHYFSDLSPEDKKVLKQLINRPSTKKLAQMVNMQPDRFMEVKRSLEHKLK